MNVCAFVSDCLLFHYRGVKRQALCSESQIDQADLQTGYLSYHLSSFRELVLHQESFRLQKVFISISVNLGDFGVDLLHIKLHSTLVLEVSTLSLVLSLCVNFKLFTFPSGGGRTHALVSECKADQPIIYSYKLELNVKLVSTYKM